MIIKKILACIMAVIMLLSAVSVFAAPESNGETEQNSDAQPAEETIVANSPHVLLLDMNTGMVIYEKGAKEKVYPSSLTSIMTALLVLENCNLEELVTASESAISSVPAGDNKVGIIKDEKLTIRQLLYGMLLSSASDAANLLAEKTSGSIEEFVKLMNSRAKELGMNNTNFTNPTGSHDERHYTTAEDMSILARKAMENETFREIVKSESYSIPATEKSPTARKITNRNHFVSSLLRKDYYYKNATGIKTGYSTAAKSCIAASAEKNGISLLALVFEAETVDNVAQSFSDCKNMFDYVFSHYTTQKVVDKGEVIAQTNVEYTRSDNKLILVSERKLNIIKPKTVESVEITYKDNLKNTVSAPVKKNQVVGEREYFMNGISIGTVNLLADKNYNLDPVTYIVDKIVDFVTSPWFFVAIIAVIILFVMMERRRRRVLRKKRRDARKKRNSELIKKMDDF